MTDLTHVESRLAAKVAEVNMGLERVRSFAIVDAQSFELAGGALLEIKQAWRELEEQRTAITAPINEGLRRANALFKPVQDPLKQAEAILKQKIAAYTIEQRKTQEEAMRATASAIASGGDGAVESAALVPMPVVAGVSVKESWTWEVVDEASVPREYLSVDPNKITAARGMYLQGGIEPPPIPGVRFFKQGRVTARSGR